MPPTLLWSLCDFYENNIRPKRIRKFDQQKCVWYEDMNYFELLAWLGIGSSHPGVFPATRQNLDAVQVKPEECMLDTGYGRYSSKLASYPITYIKK